MSAAVLDDARALAVVRRADWRFLLPDPVLGRVAYVAPHDPELVDALAVVGAEVDLLARPEPTAAHDVVVLTGAGAGLAAAAACLLRPGGRLYAETTGPGTRTWSRALHAAGYDEIEAHWLWPDAHACREIVPIAPGPLRHALGRRDPGARVRARARAATLLAASGAFAAVVRDAAVIGRWP
jgi:hypothetical protein